MSKTSSSKTDLVFPILPGVEVNAETRQIIISADELEDFWTEVFDPVAYVEWTQHHTRNADEIEELHNWISDFNGTLLAHLDGQEAQLRFDNADSNVSVSTKFPRYVD